MDPVIAQAFIHELAFIKSARTLPMKRVVEGLSGMLDPAAKAKGLGRIKQVITGSRQKALEGKYMSKVKAYGKRSGNVITADPKTLSPEHARRLGEAAKAELGERMLRKNVGRAAGGTAGVVGTGLTAGALSGGG